MDIKIQGIDKSYKKPILNGVSFDISGGECIGLLGANGSGKSTLLNILAGVIRCDSGGFYLDGENLFKNTSLRERAVAFVPQAPPLFDELTALDNLKMWYSGEELKNQLDNGVLKALGINGFLKTPVHKMSGGMKKRLAIGCALYNKPALLLMDEPSAALDLLCRQSICDYICNFKKTGGAIIIATHDVEEMKLCDRCYIIKNGSLTEYVNDGDVKRLVASL